MNAFSFDGWGINDCSDPYRPRVATFSTPKYAEKYGKLFEAAPELAEALKGVLRVADRKTAEFDAARAALEKAGIE